jgi:hypothetical protein
MIILPTETGNVSKSLLSTDFCDREHLLNPSPPSRIESITKDLEGCLSANNRLPVKIYDTYGRHT